MVDLSASGFPAKATRQPDFTYIEQGFRWIRETIMLIYAHHQHPLPMVALIFMYIETLGKPLVRERGEKEKTIPKVSLFVQKYLPGLWESLRDRGDRDSLLGDVYRNGLVHQLFMKSGHGIHEKDERYVITGLPEAPLSINIDRLVPEFLEGLNKYYQRLKKDAQFLQTFNACMLESTRPPQGQGSQSDPPPRKT